MLSLEFDSLYFNKQTTYLISYPCIKYMTSYNDLPLQQQQQQQEKQQQQQRGFPNSNSFLVKIKFNRVCGACFEMFPRI